MKNNQTKYDVIIIGAGFSGLAAALRLKPYKLKVLILEADDDIGGRSWNKVLDDGTIVELGGQWVGWQHQRMLSFINKYKLQKYTTPPFPEGKTLFQYNGKIIDEFPEEAMLLVNNFDNLTKEIDLEKPWMHPNAKLWDNITFEHWLEMQDATVDAKKMVGRIIAGGLLSRDTSHISMLQALFYVASNAGFDVATSSEKGAQHYRVIGGSYKIARKMVSDLKGTDIILNEPVTVINYDQECATVLSMNNNVYQGKYLIIAIPPVLASKIHYHPSLGSQYYGLLQNFPGGDALKVHFVYERPFWIEDNNSGNVYLQEGWLTEVTDNTTPSDPHAILTGFIYGNKKRELIQKDLEERKKLLLNELALFFGEEAKNILQYIEYDWLNSPWTGGCFSGSLRIGCWTSYGPYLRRPIGAIHWASTELSIHFNGYFEGAVLSGERAADEIIKELKIKKPKIKRKIVKKK
ncbi:MULTISPECIES: flavin monoamine oxidase family protein [unclassified Spiroplasma]|uniref:flavin monoamine oxidase family protein n=1 Tax=unclassified Spiroplasma TaxID=2637901 RepID=UPI00313AEA37